MSADDRKYLVMTWDVTGMPEWEINQLAFEAAVQSECSDEYEEGNEELGGHRDVPEPTDEIVTSASPPMFVPSDGFDFLNEDRTLAVTLWRPGVHPEHAGLTVSVCRREDRYDTWGPPDVLGTTL